MIKKYFFLLFVSFQAHCQVQIGQNINGDANWSNVALSSYGNIVAVSDSSQGNATKVYEDISGVWTQIGQNIPINGYAVSLSAFGNIIAIGDISNNSFNGAVRIYEFDKGMWKQKGQSIDGKSIGEQCGFSVSLSSNGNTVAIGAPYKAWQGDSNNPEGSIRVYSYNSISGTWNQIGQDIDGNGFAYYSGTSVSLSANGKVLAVDSVFESKTGVVRVYREINGVWIQVGNTIYGKDDAERFGRSISLSEDGSTIAIGAYRNEGMGDLRGQVRVFKNVSGVWTQIGNEIEGQSNYEQLGFGVSLSADGNTVAVGALNETPVILVGGTRIYKNISNVWTKVNNDINFGAYVSLSSNGERVATKLYGTTKVFDLRVASYINFATDDFNVYPNPTTDILNISLSNNLILEKVIFYNNLGQVVKTAKDKVVNVDSLFPGIYIVEVITNQGKAVKKVIVK